MNQITEIYKLVRSKINSDSISELSWVFAGQVTTVILSFVIVKILSGMGARDYGIYALVITVAVFVGLSFYGPVAQGFLRFYYHYLGKSLSNIFTEVIFRILIISGIALFILTIVFFAFSPLFHFSESSIFFLIAGLYIIAVKGSEFFNSVLNLIRKRKENSILQGMEKALIILLLLVLIYLKILILVNVFFILAFVAALFSIIKFSVFQKYLPSEEKQNSDTIKISAEMRSRLFQYIAPFLIWGFSGWLQLNGEKWIINGLLTTADVGIYAVMMALVNALVIVPNNIISDFATPIIFQQYSDMNNIENINTGFHYIRLNMLIIFMLTIFSTFVTYFWGKELIILISNKSYTVYGYLLPLLCLGTGLFLTGQAQTVLGMSLNLPRKYLVPKISIGFASIILNLLLIKYYGINGVAYTVLSIGFLYVAYIAVVNKKIKMSFTA